MSKQILLAMLILSGGFAPVAWGDNTPSLSDPTRPLGYSTSIKRQHYTLTSIFNKADSRAAIINGRLVKVGQTVDDFQLVSIAESSATIKTADGLRTLTMHTSVRH